MRLVHLNGDAFALSFKDYIKSYYIKAKPSLFKEIKSLYADEAKTALIEKILLEVEAEI